MAFQLSPPPQVLEEFVDERRCLFSCLQRLHIHVACCDFNHRYKVSFNLFWYVGHIHWSKDICAHRISSLKRVFYTVVQGSFHLELQTWTSCHVVSVCCYFVQPVIVYSSVSCQCRNFVGSAWFSIRCHSYRWILLVSGFPLFIMANTSVCFCTRLLIACLVLACRFCFIATFSGSRFCLLFADKLLWGCASAPRHISVGAVVLFLCINMILFLLAFGVVVCCIFCNFSVSTMDTPSFLSRMGQNSSIIFVALRIFFDNFSFMISLIFSILSLIRIGICTVCVVLIFPSVSGSGSLVSAH